MKSGQCKHTKNMLRSLYRVSKLWDCLLRIFKKIYFQRVHLDIVTATSIVQKLERLIPSGGYHGLKELSKEVRKSIAIKLIHQTKIFQICRVWFREALPILLTFMSTNNPKFIYRKYWKGRFKSVPENLTLELISLIQLLLSPLLRWGWRYAVCPMAPCILKKKRH